MTCRQIDQLLCEYLDGTLSIEQHRAFEAHVAQCAACSETLSDSKFALGFVQKVPGVEPPVELIADIIHDTIGVRGTLPVLAPVGGSAAHGLSGWLRPLFNPLLQPRFAMSMVMALLSLSMLTFYAKGALENWQTGQSRSVVVVENLGGQFSRAWEATAEFFQTLRGMYQLQREFAREPEEAPPQTAPQQSRPGAIPPETIPPETMPPETMAPETVTPETPREGPAPQAPAESEPATPPQGDRQGGDL
jgi:hypothetical protein